MNKPLALSLTVIALMVGVGIGYSFNPEYALMQQEKAGGMMELGKADRYLDQRFVDGMIAHHLSAIDMSQQALKNSHRPEIRQLAETIIKLDEAGIEELYRYKKEWYGNTQRVTTFTKVQLGESDEKFDLRFLNALIAHHEEAIEVAKEVRTKSTRTEVLNTADEVITSLSTNMNTLMEWRKAWYGIE